MAVVLVTGGAGYVGSHACKALVEAGHEPVTYDNFATGWRDAVRFGPVFEGDILDSDALDEAFRQYKPEAVMHFAALSCVPEAELRPADYWRNNVSGSLQLLSSAYAHKVTSVVFSSTCATYAPTSGAALVETSAQIPANVYGRTKLAVENLLGDFETAYGVRSVVFRYFNAAGADPDGKIGEDHRPETHLIPLVLDAASGRRDAISVFGSDYDTADGTCVRDYVHVSDLAQAHVLGLNWLLEGKDSLRLNLGTTHGHSVRDVIETARRVTGCNIAVKEADRRPGDPPCLVSVSDRAERVLGWTCKHPDLASMISDAWKWHQRGGYAR